MKDDRSLSESRSPVASGSTHKPPSKLLKHPAILKEMQHHQNDNPLRSKPFGKFTKDTKVTVRTSLTQKNSLPRVTVNDQPKRSSTISHQGGVDSQKQSTKQTFNQRLNHNIIRDEEEPSPGAATKQSFRIKKVNDNRSPKKQREDLIVLNQEETKLQKQIVDLHKRHREHIDKIVTKYQITIKGQSIGQSQISQTENMEETLLKLEQRWKEKAKHLQKHEKKIADNAYNIYLLSKPQSASIPEQSSSQEEDLVEELPSKPRIETNIGSYSQAMTGIRNKSYGLNMRRTYDIFKDSQDRKTEISIPITHNQPQQKTTQDVSITEGDNKMTLNNKFKDFLLN